MNKYSIFMFLGLFFFCLVVVDTNDRFLRKITVGQASTEKGHVREVCYIYVQYIFKMLCTL